MSRTVIAPSRPPNLQIKKSEVKTVLEKLLKDGQVIQASGINSLEDLAELQSKKTQWKEYVAEYLERAFDNETYRHQFNTSYGAMVMAMSPEDQIENFENDIRAKLISLESIIKRLELIPDIETLAPELETPHPVSISENKDVFIVHGHNEEAKEAVSGYIRSLDLVPIILHEQPNGGRTLIEKLEHYSTSVGFAIVIVTGDDMGYEKTESFENATLRPRQNVVVELGYFVGKLTREKVCVLYEEGVSIPSDLLGIVYVPYDKEDRWKLAIAKELNNAKISFKTEAAFN